VNNRSSMATQMDQLRRLQINRPEGPERPPSRKYRQSPPIVAAEVALVVGFLMWRWLSVPAVIEVETAVATAEARDASGIALSATGYIVAHHRIDVNSKVTGRVAWIGVEKGDKVQQGQVLVRLEDQEFQAQVTEAHGEVIGAEARLNALLAGSRPEEVQRDLNNLREAEAALANDKAVLDRNERLYSQKLISAQQMDEVRARYGASEHRAAALSQTYELSRLGPRKEEIERARGDLEQAKGKLAFTQSQIEATKIRAPLSGTILERTAEKGELITAQFASSLDSGGPRGSVVALADLSDLQVEVDISQDDFAKLNNIREARVSTDAYPDRQYAATIAQVSPEANRQKATIQLRVQILHPDEFLRPEMNANVNFISKEKTDAMVTPIEVPFSAVVSRNGSRKVLLVSGGKAVEKQIRLIGKKTNGYLVEGISDGDTVVVDPPAGLKTGDRIKAKAR
jgi:HlyD family secretion protein